MAYWIEARRSRGLNRVTRTVLLCGFALLVSFVPAAAATSVIPLSDSEINQYVKRLNLNQNQKPAVTSIMKRSRTEGESILKKHGVNPQSGKKPGLFQLMTLKKEFNSVVQWARAEVEKVLTPVQLREFEKIYAEGAALLRQRLLK